MSLTYAMEQAPLTCLSTSALKQTVLPLSSPGPQTSWPPILTSLHPSSLSFSISLLVTTKEKGNNKINPSGLMSRLNEPLCKCLAGIRSSDDIMSIPSASSMSSRCIQKRGTTSWLRAQTSGAIFELWLLPFHPKALSNLAHLPKLVISSVRWG